MKNILLLAHDDEGQEARLQAALDVARTVGGHLTCLDVITPPQVVAYSDYSGFVESTLIAQEQDREHANRKRVEARLARDDVAWDWHEATGLAESTIESEAGLADLIVLSLRLDEASPELRQLAGQVARGAARPVLAVPKDAKGLDLGGPVLVAWDGSREADEALRDAIPLLRLASEVILLDVDDGAFAADDAARYLSRHDIHATVEAAPRVEGETICSAILKHAHQAGAAYVVMGAFGHSPAVETMFGGVTRSMFRQSDLPLLLAH